MKLNLISFNIWCVSKEGGYTIPERAPRLHRVISPMDADLIGFQEATPTWLPLLQESFAENYEIFNVYRHHDSLESTPILWKKERFACEDKGVLWLSDTPREESAGWDSLYHCPRILTYAQLKEKSSGICFLFINTHFGFGDECQTKSAGIILDLIREKGLPAVITGDFNMDLCSAGYAAITAGVKDVNMETEKDTSPTFHGLDPNYKGEHIDYCFVSPEVTPVSYRVIRDAVEEMLPSDHYGVFAKVEINA